MNIAVIWIRSGPGEYHGKDLVRGKIVRVEDECIARDRVDGMRVVYPDNLGSRLDLQFRDLHLLKMQAWTGVISQQ